MASWKVRRNEGRTAPFHAFSQEARVQPFGGRSPLPVDADLATRLEAGHHQDVQAGINTHDQEDQDQRRTYRSGRLGDR